MFKRIFSKYVGTFMLILVFCFLLITLLISSIVHNYSREEKLNIMQSTADSARIYLENASSIGNAIAPETASAHAKDMLTVLSGNADDLTLLVTNTEGRILLSVGSDAGALLCESVPTELLRASEKTARSSTLFTFETHALSAPLLAEEGAREGYVVVCTRSLTLDAPVRSIINATVMIIVCVLLAALIAVYMLTERITAPLKEISRATKHFARGDFDVRVRVRGNDEISELAVAMNTMAESLNNYDKMRNSFMSNVSHDLRSPMTSISGFIDGILDGVIPPEKHEYYLRIVSSEIKRLSRLVSTLLDLSRIQAGERKFVMSPFDLCELAREILISFEQKIEEKHLDVSLDCPEDALLVSADRDAVHQVIYNLCDNALKFSCDGGELKICVKRLKNKKAVLTVYNNGQGIAEADIPYVFERFYKSDKSRGLNKNGVGLGLYICKTIVDAHGERIWAESEYGKDCSFSFTLPLE